MSNINVAFLLITGFKLVFSLNTNFSNILNQNEIFQDLGFTDQHESCIEILKVTFPQDNKTVLELDPFQSVKLPLNAVQNKPSIELSKKYRP